VIFTLGYEGASLDAVLSTLKQHKVVHVVDVRLTPLSRKRGFSKTALATAVHEWGIYYSHRPELGCPKDIRKRYQVTGDFSQYAKSYYRRVLSRRMAEVIQLAREAHSKHICLLCFEADAARCHRSLVAAAACELTQGATRYVHLAAGRISQSP